MLNKLGYIELYISKTRIYRSFSEVPLPFKSMLITFHISNSSKSLESSQFRDQHTDRNQLTLLSFLNQIYHSYIEHFKHIGSNQHFTVSLSSVGAIVSIIAINSFIFEENNDCIIFHSVSILCYTLCYLNGSDG